MLWNTFLCWIDAPYIGVIKNALLFAFTIVLAISAIAGYRVHLVSQLREPMLAKLNYPEAPEFRNEIYLGDWTVTGGTLCGQVSASSLRAKTEGFQWFSVADGVFIETEDLRRQFDAAGIRRCAKDGKPPGTPWWWMYW